MDPKEVSKEVSKEVPKEVAASGAVDTHVLESARASLLVAVLFSVCGPEDEPNSIPFLFLFTVAHKQLMCSWHLETIILNNVFGSSSGTF